MLIGRPPLRAVNVGTLQTERRTNLHSNGAAPPGTPESARNNSVIQILRAGLVADIPVDQDAAGKLANAPKRTIIGPLPETVKLETAT